MPIQDIFGIQDAVKRLSAPAGLEAAHLDGMSWAREGERWEDTSKLSAKDWNQIIANLRWLVIGSGLDPAGLDRDAVSLLSDAVDERIALAVGGIAPGPGGSTGGGSNVVATVANLLALTDMANNAVVTVLGRLGAGDGGGGHFRWSAASTTFADGGTVFGTAPYGRWHRLIEGDWSTAWFGIVADGGAGNTDCSIAVNAVIKALSDAGGGTLRMEWLPHTAPFYVNATLRVESGVHLRPVNPWLYGTYGRGAMQGGFDTGAQNYHVRAGFSGPSEEDTANGVTTTTIPCGANIQNNYTHYTLGDRLVITGQNDITGNALYLDHTAVVAIDAANNNIVVSPPVQHSYQPSYPSSLWPNDQTLIVIVQQSPMTANALRHDKTVTVDDATKFAVGRAIYLEDTKIGTNISGVSNNQVHQEINEVQAINGNVLTLVYPLAHDYELAYKACVELLDPVRDASVEGARISWAAVGYSNSAHGIATKYAVDVAIRDCKCLGDPVAGLGNRGHGFRLGEGTLRGSVKDCLVYRPIGYEAGGGGYGCTIYQGARDCRIEGSEVEGARHSYLLFNCAGNRVTGNFSTDCRGTDIDLHGAEEVDNFIGFNTIVGGPSTTPSINTKAALKIGNPSHRGGTLNNVFQDNHVRDYPGYGAHLLPNLQGVTIKDNTFERCALGGVYVQKNSADLNLKIFDPIIEDNVFIGIDRALYVDSDRPAAVGGVVQPASAQRTTFLNNEVRRAPGALSPIQAKHCDDLTVQGNDVDVIGNTGGVFDLDFSDVLGLKVHDNSLNGGTSGVQLDDCPGAVVDETRFLGLASRLILLEDGTASAGAVFNNYEAIGFDPIFTIGVGSTTQFLPKRKASKAAQSTLPRPTAIAGSTSNIPVNTTTDATTGQGVEVVAATIKPKTPKGTIKATAHLPMINTDVSASVVAVMFADTGVGPVQVQAAVMKLGSVGTSSGSGLTIVGLIPHGLTDLSQVIAVSVRLGPKETTATLTVNNAFTAATPTLVLEEL